MLTLLDDWVSLVLPPSAADSPDMTSALEKLLLPKRKLRVELVEEPRLDRMSASARSRTPRWRPVVRTGGGWECRDAAEVFREGRLPEGLWASSCTDVDVRRKAWWLSRMGPEELRVVRLWLIAECAWTDWLLPFLLPARETRARGQACKKYLVNMGAGLAPFHYDPQINLTRKVASSRTKPCKNHILAQWAHLLCANSHD